MISTRYRKALSTLSSCCLLLSIFSPTTALEKPDSIVEVKTGLPHETYNYGQVLYLSSFFYEAQRSGKLSASNRVPWRGDSALTDGQDVKLDLTGGWYDAGDHLKFTFPMAFTITTLSWGLLEYWDAYESVGETDRMLDTIKWPLDYLIKAHPEPEVLYYQVGDGGDHNFWGPPEFMTMPRPAFKVDSETPGSDIAGEAAAAMAAASMVFKEKDQVYSATLLVHARQLFDFADKYRGIGSTQFYSSTGYLDELAWAAVWLYKATGEQPYLDKAESLFKDCCSIQSEGWTDFNWDSKDSGAQLLLYHTTGADKYMTGINDYLTQWTTEIPRTPKGMSFFSEWGSNRYTANSALVALLAADYGLNTEANRKWAKSQMDYILGDSGGGIDPTTGNPKFSYLIGFGDNFPRAPHHRSSSCDGPNNCDCSTAPHPHVLYGALVGGPGPDDNYEDTCQDYIHNEVACDYNAALTSAAAALRHLSLTNQMP